MKKLAIAVLLSSALISCKAPAFVVDGVDNGPPERLADRLIF